MARIRKSTKRCSTTEVNVYTGKWIDLCETIHETIKCNASVLTNANVWSLSSTKLIIVARMKLTERAMRAEREKRCAKRHTKPPQQTRLTNVTMQNARNLIVFLKYLVKVACLVAQNACKSEYIWTEQQQHKYNWSYCRGACSLCHVFMAS